MNPSAQTHAPTQIGRDTSATILWVCDDRPGANIEAAFDRGFRMRAVPMNDSLERHAAGACGAVIDVTGDNVNVRRISAMLDQLERARLIGLLLVDDRTAAADRFVGRAGPFARCRMPPSPRAPGLPRA